MFNCPILQANSCHVGSVRKGRLLVRITRIRPAACAGRYSLIFIALTRLTYFTPLSEYEGR
jgi:hypothetical protein